MKCREAENHEKNCHRNHDDKCKQHCEKCKHHEDKCKKHDDKCKEHCDKCKHHNDKCKQHCDKCRKHSCHCCCSDHGNHNGNGNRRNALTTGPFRVDDQGQPNRLVIGLKNHTDEDLSVRVIVDRCEEAIYPAVSQEEQILRKRVNLGPGECTQIEVDDDIEGGDLLRVTFIGDIDRNATAIEATVVGLFQNGTQDPTMFFRHGDLVRTFPPTIGNEE